MTEPLERLQAALADRYRVERELGAGGMATVYLAEDLKHHRKVAVKVLHPELAAVLGAERFLVEIQTTANLQHPHILPLHDSGQADGLLFYVMPYVEGESLRQRLAREQQLPVDEAVRIAREVASALDYAHRHGVIHRDIKPENILLHEGQALIADFGIALAVSSAGGQRMTQTGMSLGTPEYMSPEQALGERTITPKSDLYALGCVLYEMLTGEPPFTGATVQAVVARLVAEEPRPISLVRKTVPPHVEDAVLQALAKLPADRPPSTGDFASQLVSPQARTTGFAPPARGSAQPARAQARMWSAVAVIVGVAGGIGGYWLGRSGPPALETFDVGLPDSAPMSLTRGGAYGSGWRALDLAPDGTFLVYRAERGEVTQLWYRGIGSVEARPLPGTDSASIFVLSPDGGRVAFTTSNAIRVHDLVRNQTTDVATGLGRLAGLWWSSPTTLLVSSDRGGPTASQEGGLIRLSLEAGTRETMPMGGCIGSGASSEDGRLICSGQRGFPEALWYLSPDGPPVNMRAGATSDSALRRFGTDPHLTGNDVVVGISESGALIASRILRGEGPRLGPPQVLLQGLRTEAASDGQFALSQHGTLAFVPGDDAGSGRLVSAGSGGMSEPLRVQGRAFVFFDVSVANRRLAGVHAGPLGAELWVYDLDSGRKDLVLERRRLMEPRWNPEGNRIVIEAEGEDGQGQTIIVTPGSTAAPEVLPVAFVPSQWPRTDLVLGHVDREASNDQDVISVHLEGASGPKADTLPLPGSQHRAALSPDGRWLAFMSGDDVLIEDFPSRSRRSRIGTGLDPLWLGPAELVIRDRQTWNYLAIDPATGRLAGASRPSFTDPRFVDTPWRSQTLLSDGRVVYVQGPSATVAHYVRIMPGFSSVIDRVLGPN